MQHSNTSTGAFPSFPSKPTPGKDGKVDKKPVTAWEEFQKRIASVNEVMGWFEKYSDLQLGVTTGKLSNLLVVDGDSMSAIDMIEGLIPEGMMVPTQLTPRPGKHYFFKHTEGFTNRANYYPGTDVRTTGGFLMIAPSVNFKGQKWEWAPGRSIFEVDPPEIPEKLKEWLLARVINKDRGDTGAVPDEKKDYFNDGTRDDDLFSTAWTLAKGGARKEFMVEVLTRIVNSWGENDPKWVQSKVESALKRAGNKEESTEALVKRFIEDATGYFSMEELYRHLGVGSTDERNNILTMVQAMDKEAVVTPTTDRNGVYRKVNKNPKIMDLSEEDGEPCKIELPFLLHTIVQLYPKNVIIVAGEKDSGKSAFGLNVAYMNRDIMPVRYFSSEMARAEINGRLAKFPPEFILEEWKKITWVDESSNFQDFIDPEGFNIIDYLEIGADAYVVVEDIRKVFDKLTTGMLLIIMQKRSYKEFAVGGEGTLEKARLAINLKKGGFGKITVAKNWTGILDHPRGKVCEYSIVQGGKMTMTDYWHDPEPEPPKERKAKNTKNTTKEKKDEDRVLNWVVVKKDEPKSYGEVVNKDPDFTQEKEE